MTGPALDLRAWLRPGDRIVIGHACGEPSTLVEALIEQGAGIGGLSAFVATSLSGRFAPGIGRSVAISSMGAIGALRLCPTSHTHGAAVLARIENLVTLNSALEVDLTAQVNAEQSRTSYIGGIGGQVDFVRAGLRSPGGRAITALPATARGGPSAGSPLCCRDRSPPPAAKSRWPSPNSAPPNWGPDPGRTGSSIGRYRPPGLPGGSGAHRASYRAARFLSGRRRTLRGPCRRDSDHHAQPPAHPQLSVRGSPGGALRGVAPFRARSGAAAFAGGWMIAQACDLCVASTTATFAVSEVKVGRSSPWAAPLIHMIPQRVMMEILLTGTRSPRNARTRSAW